MTTVEKLACGGIVLVTALAIWLSVGRERDASRPDEVATESSSTSADWWRGIARAPPPTPAQAEGRAGDAAPDLGSFLGAEWRPGGYVIGPSPSPTAAAAGLRPGDVITMVDGRPFVGGVLDVRLVDAKREAGGVELTGRRSGAPLVAALAF